MKANFLAELLKVLKLRELYWLLITVLLLALIISIGQVSITRPEFGHFWSNQDSNKWLSVITLKFTIFGLFYPLLFTLFANWTVYNEFKEKTSTYYPLLPSSGFEQFSAKFLSLSLSFSIICLLSSLLFPVFLLIFNWQNAYLQESPVPWTELFTLSLFLMIKVFISLQGFLAIIFLVSFFIDRLILSIPIIFIAWLVGLLTGWEYYPSNIALKSIVSWQRHVANAGHLHGSVFITEIVSLVYLCLVFLFAYFRFSNNHLFKI